MALESQQNERNDQKKNIIADSKKRNSTREKFKPVRESESNTPNPDSDDSFKSNARLIFLVIGLVIGFFLINRLFSNPEQTGPLISYNEYRKVLSGNLVKSVVVERSFAGTSKLIGEFHKPELVLLSDNRTEKKTLTFSVSLPDFTSSAANEITEKGVLLSVVEQEVGIKEIFIQFLPWVVLILIFFYMMRRMSAQGGVSKNVFNFGKSKAKLISELDTKTTFADVAGCDEAKEELHEVVDFLKEPEKFTKLGGKTPKGVLLLGPPGTGKTLLAKAVAGEAGVPFFSMSGADFVEMFVGVGASRVRDLFEQAKRNAPCIVFIDEIDAVGRQRGAGLGGGHDEREQTLNQLLVEMDGFNTTDNIILIAATNRPDVLDSALLRPGRFDRQVVVDKPDIRGREAILKIHSRKIPLASSVSLKEVARSTPGFSGADLANLMNESAIFAARNNREEVLPEDINNARDKILMGPERKSAVISEHDKKVTSYHESGHVLVAKFTKGSDPVHKVTIIPRGRALGVTSYMPLEDKHTYTKEYLLAIITYALGGRAAEEIIFNQISTGAGNDIERATEIARKMVCEWGMSERLGPLNYGTKHQEVFLGRDFSRMRDYSEETAQSIDEEVRAIVTDSMKNALKILTDNIETLHRLASELLERETLTAEEIDKIIAGEILEPLQSPA
ncbi:MAG: ATP-dependent zinc metalloprotease FtsH [Chloroherpetonaceae bacterium]|nr:ATP-dependent zinc metalloprotease FtsH [Chloroherpetonaceae bacterium]